MNLPMRLTLENKLRRDGYKCIIGIDEAGMGPLAGPVTAAAVYVHKNIRISRDLTLVQDSKMLSANQRERAFNAIVTHPHITYSVSHVSPGVIDSINIRRASHLAMKRSIQKLFSGTGIPKKTYILIDGTATLDAVATEQRAIVRGDQKIFSVAAASIIAKVTRDRIMHRMHKKYPKYHLTKHKGYGTRLHRDAISKFGPSPIHRKTYLRNIV